METNKPKRGRIKGQPNKVTTSLKTRIDLFINRNFEGIQSEYESLPAKEKLNFISQMLSYSVPKMASTTTEISLSTKLENMTTIQLENVIEQVLLNEEN
jgi:hypothetical protein